MNKIAIHTKWAIVLLATVMLGRKSIAQAEIKLYEGIPEGNLNNVNKEIRVKTDAGRDALTKVTYPSVYYFKPNAAQAQNTAVIICPGGGYHRLSIFDGGFDVAKELTAVGMHVFVLKYRTFVDSAYTQYETLPFQDLKTAYHIITKNANDWGIDTTKIGLMGFSAGGHLAAMASTPQHYLPLAFQVLVYPVVSFNDALVSSRLQSRKMLLGKNITEEKKRFYSPELWVSDKNPPTYLIHAMDDTQSLVGNSLEYYKALLAKNRPTQMLLYQKGGHGFALYNKEQDEYWMPSAIKWLKFNKILR
jgi:acetyl esterase/lipase